jgi:hypothetical protein
MYSLHGCGEICVWQWIFIWLFFLKVDRSWSWCGEIGAGWMLWKEENINISTEEARICRGIYLLMD